MIRQRIHTGCSCSYCRAGKTRKVRSAFSRKVRRRHKAQLKNLGEIIDVDLSIGYTD